jgi:hypothetical protein
MMVTLVKVSDIVEVSKDVVSSHLLEVVGPELLFGDPSIGIVLDKVTVGVTARVAEPNIVDGSGGDECVSNIGPVHHPGVSGSHQPVLHEDDGLGSRALCLTDQAWNTEDCKDVTIFSRNGMRFELETVLVVAEKVVRLDC